MRQAFSTVAIATRGPGLYAFTDQAASFLKDEKAQAGLLTCYIRHTSASLLIQENADPDVLADLKDFFARITKGQTFRHDAEGPDDMPSHIKSALTQTSLSIPVAEGKAVLGAWQGLYVFEHRDAPHRREVVVSVMGE